MGHFTCLALVLLACGCSCVPLSWEDLGTGGLIRSRWFAGTAYANGRLFVFGGQGTGTSINDTGLLGKMGKAYMCALAMGD